jgi:hypothetical protein
LGVIDQTVAEILDFLKIQNGGSRHLGFLKMAVFDRWSCANTHS